MKYIKIPKEVEFILNRLYKAGHEAYVVGGAIRDWLLGKDITDWDVNTSASSDQIKEIFKDKNIFSLKHDTVTVVMKKKNYEITPFKGGTLITDLMHRDFTINAIAYDPIKEIIIDPVNGKGDISKKVIRATENAYARFNEDPLRTLRAIRFSVELGFRIDKKTMDAIIDMAHLITTVSEERIRDELLKILVSPIPSKGIVLIQKTGLIKYIIPELMEGYGIRQNHYHKYTVFKHILITLDKVDSDPILRLSALFHDIGKPRTKRKVKGRVVFYGHEEKSAEIAVEIMKRLKFSNEMISKVDILVRNHMINYSPDWNDATVRRFINKVGKDTIMYLILLRKADLEAHGKNKFCEIKLLEELTKRINRELEKGFAFSIKDLQINGNIIMDKLNIPQGPKVGKILKLLYEKVIERPELNNTKTLLSIAKDLKDSL